MSYTPPPPPPYGPGDYGHGGYAAPRTNPKALWSMILGILGIVFCGLFAGIPALILGNTAKKEIAASHGAETGEGMAKAGVILGWVSVAISALGLLLVIGGVLGTGQYQTG
jgi:putative exporter of polyketide antibiotics